MKVKNRIALFIAALVLTATVALSAFAFTGCGNASGSISLVGSTSMEEVMGVINDAFMKANPGIDVSMTCNGSGEGIEAAQDGSCTFGMASRDLKDSETGVVQATIAIDGIAVVTQTTTGAQDVTFDELYNLYASGTSFTDNNVTVTAAVGRETGSGTRSAFDELVVNSAGVALEKANEGNGYNSNVAQPTTTGAVINAVKSATTPTVGYISLGSVTSEVKKLKVEGVEATNENMINGTYKLMRNFNLILPEGGYDKLDEAGKLFYDFVMGDEGQKILEDEGYLPVAE